MRGVFFYRAGRLTTRRPLFITFPRVEVVRLVICFTLLAFALFPLQLHIFEFCLLFIGK